MPITTSYTVSSTTEIIKEKRIEAGGDSGYTLTSTKEILASLPAEQRTYVIVNATPQISFLTNTELIFASSNTNNWNDVMEAWSLT